MREHWLVPQQVDELEDTSIAINQPDRKKKRQKSFTVYILEPIPELPKLITELIRISRNDSLNETSKPALHIAEIASGLPKYRNEEHYSGTEMVYRPVTEESNESKLSLYYGDFSARQSSATLNKIYKIGDREEPLNSTGRSCFSSCWSWFLCLLCCRCCCRSKIRNYTLVTLMLLIASIAPVVGSRVNMQNSHCCV